jgi:hypothetical protein
VLWHPEQGEDFELFRELVEEARRYHEEARSGGPRSAPAAPGR